jgi:PAT family beta-lactamase induction signal transducer AmpG
MIEKRNPWAFIPTQYFAEGLPYVLVNTLSVAMYSSLGASNEFIGLTSFLYLPWSLKLFWSPYVDANSTKRNWVIKMQMAIAILFVLVAIIVQMPMIYTGTLILFSLIAFLSATHDIVTDGFYLHALDKKDQAFFTGIRSTFYRLSMIFGSGFLVWFAGYYGHFSGNISNGWSASFMIAGLLFLVFYFYHGKFLPYPQTDKPIRDSNENISKIPFAIVFKQYFKQDKIGVVLAYILLYRFGEGLLVKMAQPFLLAPTEKGGLAISLEKLGVMYGTFGVLALVAGGILGGWAIKQFGLKKLIWLMAICMNVPNLLYAYLAYTFPSIYVVQVSIIIEQFGYGFGFSAFLVYLLYISKGQFKTSFYAISTGLMAVGMMLPGFVSGYLQAEIGYFWLFILSFLFTIPGMLTIFFLPFPED